MDENKLLKILETLIAKYDGVYTFDFKLTKAGLTFKVIGNDVPDSISDEIKQYLEQENIQINNKVISVIGQDIARTDIIWMKTITINKVVDIKDTLKQSLTNSFKPFGITVEVQRPQEHIIEVQMEGWQIPDQRYKSMVFITVKENNTNGLVKKLILKARSSQSNQTWSWEADLPQFIDNEINSSQDKKIMSEPSHDALESMVKKISANFSINQRLVLSSLILFIISIFTPFISVNHLGNISIMSSGYGIGLVTLGLSLGMIYFVFKNKYTIYNYIFIMTIFVVFMGIINICFTVNELVNKAISDFLQAGSLDGWELPLTLSPSWIIIIVALIYLVGMNLVWSGKLKIANLMKILPLLVAISLAIFIPGIKLLNHNTYSGVEAQLARRVDDRNTLEINLERNALDTLTLALDKAFNYYNRNYIFSNDWDALELSSAKDSDFYNFGVLTASNDVFYVVAIPKQNNLRSYSAILYLTESETNKVANTLICRTTQPSVASALIRPEQSGYLCSEGSEIVEK